MHCGHTSLGAVTEEVVADLSGEPLHLVRLGDLAGLVDREALLSDAHAPEPPYWAHLWPAARVLAGLVSAAGSRLEGRRVIELGCGLGLPGLVAARSAASVVLLDRNRDALAFAARNLSRNGLRGLVVGMDWGCASLRREFDLCLAADVTYDPAAHRALLAFLEAHLAPNGEIWIAESVRAEEPQLPSLLRERFEVYEQRIAAYEDGHRVWVRVLQGSRRR